MNDVAEGGGANATMSPLAVAHLRRRAPDASRLTVRVVDDWEEVAAIASDIDELAENALEPSPSAEAWTLVPALRYLREGASIKVVLMYAPDTVHQDERNILCAVFPMHMRRKYRGLRISVYSIWNHLYSLLPAPLLHASCAAECIRTLFAWIATNSGSTLLEFPAQPTESKFFHALNEVLRTDERNYLLTDVVSRAWFRPGHDAQHYLDTIATKHHRHEMRRQERRLSELGILEYDAW